ncbi:MAG: pentapeptide repeat-containing protein [Chloroflexi bacterium]|nr:pentapeptide repeat-containing protein [Chloroflexota bacterium]
MREEHDGLQQDQRAVAESIRSRESVGRNIEDQSSFILDLNSTDLKGVWFNGAVLARADFSLTCLEEAKLNNADLSHGVFYRANLEGASIHDSELTGAKFSLDGQHPATGLTQEQLDNAWSKEDSLPTLDGVVDAVTGRQLTPPKRRMSFDKEMEQWRLEIERMLDER